jgi:hypothetical protein
MTDVNALPLPPEYRDKLEDAWLQHLVENQHLSDDERRKKLFAQLIVTAKNAGASNRSVAKALGFSESTFRRMWNDATASNDADPPGNLNEANEGNVGAASNDASPPLKAILRNLPRLTAAERDVVRKELDILSM